MICVLLVSQHFFELEFFLIYSFATSRMRPGISHIARTLSTLPLATYIEIFFLVWFFLSLVSSCEESTERLRCLSYIILC